MYKNATQLNVGICLASARHSCVHLHHFKREYNTYIRLSSRARKIRRLFKFVLYSREYLFEYQLFMKTCHIESDLRFSEYSIFDDMSNTSFLFTINYCYVFNIQGWRITNLLFLTAVETLSDILNSNYLSWSKNDWSSRHFVSSIKFKCNLKYTLYLC